MATALVAAAVALGWGDRVHAAATPAAVTGAALVLAAGNVAFVWAAVRASVRAPVIGRRWRGRLRVHLAVAAGASLGLALAGAVAHALVAPVGEALSPMAVVQHVPGYAVLAAFAHAVVLGRRVRRIQAGRARLDRLLARAGREQATAELRALKAELHPVVVARALDATCALVHRDAAAAERVIVQLGAMMREAVVAAEADEVPLADELDAFRAAADHDAAPRPALAVAHLAYDVDEAARDLLVPHMVLPALLTCAAEAGGAGPAPMGELLVLRARRRVYPGGARLEMAIAPADTGGDGTPRSADVPGARTAPAVAGPGAATLRRRLVGLYGRGARLSTGQGRTGEPLVALSIPARDDGAPPIGSAVQEAASRAGVRTFEATVEPWLVAAANEQAAPRAGPALDVLLVSVLGVSLLALVPWIWWVREGAAPAPGRVAGLAVALLVLGVAAVFAARRWPGVVATRATLRGHVTSGLIAAGVAAGVRWGTDALWGATVWGPAEFALRLLHLLALYGVLAVAADAVVLGLERRRAASLAGRLRAAVGVQARDRTQSELRALKAELNPHFVGNALHTAAALARRDPDAAAHVLGALSTLAQEAGTRVDAQEVLLAEEIAGLQPFLALERARLGTVGGTLDVRWELTPDALGARVPHLVLQPLAENAVRHGLAPRGGSGCLVVRARRMGARLELAVQDDGVGLDAVPGAGAPQGAASSHRRSSGGVGAGAGLGGVRRRLTLLYGADAGCVLEAAPGGGTVARLTLPYRPGPSPGETEHTLVAAGG